MGNTVVKVVIGLVAIVVMFAAGMLGAVVVQRYTNQQDKLVQRVTDAVIKKMQHDGAMDKVVDAGIRRFVTRQRDAEQQAEQQRRAAMAKRAVNVAPPSPKKDHIYGKVDAPISLIEYADFECPYCKHFYPTARELVDTSDGKVNWVYRDYPLSFHNPAAEQEAEAAECVAALAGNGAYWKFADLLYANTGSNGHGVPAGKLTAFAKRVGVKEAQFTKCVKSHRYAARVQSDLKEGTAIGILGTPGNILRNNRTGKVVVRPGAVPLASLKADVATLLH